jgi:hypothetical protein
MDAISQHEDYAWPRWMSRWKERRGMDLLDEKYTRDVDFMDEQTKGKMGAG